jgi:hypothetical protein
LSARYAGARSRAALRRVSNSPWDFSTTYMLRRIACRFGCFSSHSALLPQPDLVFLNLFIICSYRIPHSSTPTAKKRGCGIAMGEMAPHPRFRWVWHCNGEMAPYDVDDDVFFLVRNALLAH